MVERGKSYEGHPPPIASGISERRVALVIGNSDYPIARLKNPRNDAELFASRLNNARPPFDVTLALDVGRDAMERALEEFERELSNCDTALLFYAGHGLQVKGINFLIPVDADIRQEVHLRRRAFSLNEVLDLMGNVRTSSLVFLDACRDNPFARSLLALPEDERGRSLTRSGLAKVHSAPGSFIAFATAPDNIAHDGTGANSPFTAALATHMTTPGISINDLMIAVRRDVLKATGGRQEPWDQSSLREHFRFCELPAMDARMEVAKPRGSASGSLDEALLERIALEYWEAIRELQTLVDCASSSPTTALPAWAGLLVKRYSGRQRQFGGTSTSEARGIWMNLSILIPARMRSSKELSFSPRRELSKTRLWRAE